MSSFSVTFVSNRFCKADSTRSIREKEALSVRESSNYQPRPVLSNLDVLLFSQSIKWYQIGRVAWSNGYHLGQPLGRSGVQILEAAKIFNFEKEGKNEKEGEAKKKAK